MQLNKRVFAIQLGFLLAIPILTGFPYMYVTLNMNAEQLRWVIFAHIWEAIFFGFFLVLMPLIWLKPINRFLETYYRKEVIEKEEVSQVQNLALKFPIKVALFTFILVFAIGYPIGLVQFYFFAKMHWVEILKAEIMGLISGILYSLFVYFFLERILKPVVKITEKKGSSLKKINKIPVFYKIFVILLSLVLFSLVFLGTLGYSKAKLAVEKNVKILGSQKLEHLISETKRLGGNFTTDMLKEAKVGKEGYVFIADNKGQIISDHPLGYQTLDEEKTLKEIKEKILKGGKGNYTDVVSTKLFAYAPYKDWRIISALEGKESIKDVNQIVVMSFSIAAVAFIFSFLLSLLFAKSVSESIKKLAEAADLVAEKGDLNQRIYIRPNDEIGLLAESLDKMILKLKENQETLKRTNIELEKRVKEKLGPYDEKIKELEDKVGELERIRDNLEDKLRAYI
ncbi:MAG: hypothetical protein A3D38_00695 [Candidatus Portnoybacteria bacterium RIFCSPHIGHO2_02_FULL_40_23]|nr:MAG: hypothetical protein A3D38_00695 [Candidatus Portnoybacteria bacterium RIFCSPHIGHO2_02_FULL_40_23]